MDVNVHIFSDLLTLKNVLSFLYFLTYIVYKILDTKLVGISASKLKYFNKIIK